MTSWQEWLEEPKYSTPPPQAQPRKSDFSFSFNPLLFFPFMPPPEPYFNPMFKPYPKSKMVRSGVRHHHYHPFMRWTYTPPYSPGLDYHTEHTNDHFYGKSEDELFMPKGKPGLMLSQNGLESSRSDSNQHDHLALPDDISNLVFDLERDPVKPIPHICLDDSGFLKNEYDEMNDIIGFKEDDLNDSGIVTDSNSSKSESPSPPPPTKLQPQSVHIQLHHIPSKLSSPSVIRKNICQFCQKQYQSISGLKYHLKKAQNECSAKFKQCGPNHPLILPSVPLPS